MPTFFSDRSLEVKINMSIHPTAIIAPDAQIDPSVEIGPYVVIEGKVKIGPNCRIDPHVVVKKYTTMGSGNVIHSSAVIGDDPQDLAFEDKPSYVRIGDNNTIREFATIHRGTAPESETVIGNHCFIMACSHIAHNCRLADHVKLANCALLAGYVSVGEGTFISGSVVVHQFARIGRLCMVAGGARVPMDLPPFMMAHGEGDCIGINRVGLKRAGFTSKQIQDLRTAYRLLYLSGLSFGKALTELEASNPSEPVKEMIDFIRAKSKRGIAGPPPGARIKSAPIGDSDV
jgi:UDP-N-acetylglucosamine acyltransferase